MPEYIDIQAVKDAIKKEWDGCGGQYGAWVIIKDTCDAIDELPPADVRPVVRGKWVHPNLGFDYYRCSVCGYEHRWPLPFNFCPNCDADMREQEGKPKKDPFEGWSEELKETYRKLLASLHLEGGDAE